jgi:hypothetical protein
MKTCWKCKQTKKLTEFCCNKSNFDGLATECRPCKLEIEREYVAKNKEATRERKRRWYNENKERMREINKKYHFEKRKDTEWVKQQKKRADEHRKNNLGKYAAKESRRRTAKLNASVSWADQKYIEDLYKNCREAEDIFNNAGLNIKFHVDHIVPLQNDKVCGLHVEHNLQILTAEDNLSKSNSFEVI